MKTTLPLSIADFKKEASALRKNTPSLKSHGQALNELAKVYGFKNWKTLRPSLPKESTQPPSVIKNPLFIIVIDPERKTITEMVAENDFNSLTSIMGGSFDYKRIEMSDFTDSLFHFEDAYDDAYDVCTLNEKVFGLNLLVPGSGVIDELPSFRMGNSHITSCYGKTVITGASSSWEEVDLPFSKAFFKDIVTWEGDLNIHQKIPKIEGFKHFKNINLPTTKGFKKLSIQSKNIIDKWFLFGFVDKLSKIAPIHFINGGNLFVSFTSEKNHFPVIVGNRDMEESSSLPFYTGISSKIIKLSFVSKHDLIEKIIAYYYELLIDKQKIDEFKKYKKINPVVTNEDLLYYTVGYSSFAIEFDSWDLPYIK